MRGVERLIQHLPPEAAHRAAIQALRFGLAPKLTCPSLPVQLGKLKFDNPLGLAAGFDKNAEAIRGAMQLGFGHVEVGTITPEPQPGNPKPRIYRLPEDKAVINRYGFNSAGRDVCLRNLRAFRDEQKLKAREKQLTGILGVNIGANKTSIDKAHKDKKITAITDDYYNGAFHFSPLADYLTVNISSPNTAGLRDLQNAMRLPDILGAVFSGMAAAGADIPIMVKLAPDMQDGALEVALDQLLAAGVAGVILTNTTTQRPDSLKSKHAHEVGGLSGAPLFDISNEILLKAHQHLIATDTRDRLALIGVGGIRSASDLYVKILLGADLAQLYTAMAIQGPNLASEILTALSRRLRAENISDIAELRGQAKSVSEAMQLERHNAPKD